MFRFSPQKPVRRLNILRTLPIVERKLGFRARHPFPVEVLRTFMGRSKQERASGYSPGWRRSGLTAQEITMNESVQAPRKTGSQRRTRVRGIDRTLQILDCLQNRQCPITTYEVAKDLAAPLSSIYSLVEVLVANRILERDETGMIWLGARLYRYGLAYARVHGPLGTSAVATAKGTSDAIALHGDEYVKAGAAGTPCAETPSES
ncbi:helix-turn-helix domain-containing protein [Sodalis glossinidius]|uniref:helix-turn-helix domain-containing protein n=1 Tax=Sodalis glossinidius TaxID=63612 RepID=UPI000325CE39|nr:helix-turn-helix domain-containing protein [Sodalis glossinidius]